MSCCKAFNTRKWLYVLLAIAACVGILFAVLPMFQKKSVIDELGIKRPRVAKFRAAIPELAEVETLMNNDEYYDAIDIVEGLLKESDKSISGYDKEQLNVDEELMYEYQLQKMVTDELRWTYIYLLVVLESERSAIKELKKYLGDEACVHREEAEDMLDALL